MISFTVSENCPALMGTKSLAPSAKSGKISQPVSSTCAWHPAELASAWAQAATASQQFSRSAVPMTIKVSGCLPPSCGFGRLLVSANIVPGGKRGVNIEIE